MKRIILLLTLFSFMLVAQDNSGETTPPPKPKVKTKVLYKKKTAFDFSGDSIKGDFKKPKGFLMIHRSQTDFSEIIQFDLRFKDKVKKSVGYLE